MENRLITLIIKSDKYGIDIRGNNGGYIISKVLSDCIYIDQIDFSSWDEGQKMMNELKKIAAYVFERPIDIIALPSYNEKVTEEELKLFLKDNFFTLHPDDVDHTYYRWG